MRIAYLEIPEILHGFLMEATALELIPSPSDSCAQVLIFACSEVRITVKRNLYTDWKELTSWKRSEVGPK